MNRSSLLRRLLAVVAGVAVLAPLAPAPASAAAPAPAVSVADIVCQVQLVRQGPNFVVNVVVVNTEPVPLTNWTIRFTVPSATTVGYPNHATLTRVGTDGTLTPVHYYATLAPGAAAVVGFNGTILVPGQWPYAFHLNGMPCPINYY
ncbi:cellulose binding domain-containing protein [Phytohabitans suffuscus]|uniref:CBM2 domain-containing protein n=1 Tax=Phytohabitans suffuscus TaxID=624315 RepID=A0A6F8YB63_9ACTN|nr:cellulose binding domain-containing protein [Phytohabitans suffuscus]BCB83307.1 hypothetical protein Psuf_006200 [Phytohabitans suffuscus]